MALALSDLFTPWTRQQVEDGILAVCAGVELPTTTWQPLGTARTIIASVSQKVADFTSVMALIARGGLLDFAANPDGEPSNPWLDLLVQSDCGIERIPATYAAGSVTLTNATPVPEVVNVGDLRLAHATTGKLFTNTAGGTVPANGTLSLAVRADEAGAASTAGPGSLTVMVTPRLGISVTNPLSLVGADAETDRQLVARAREKRASLSPNGPRDAYSFFAKTQADGKTPIATSAPITRVLVVANKVTGIVTVYVASAVGAVSEDDVELVDDNIQATCVPMAVTAEVVSAVAKLVPVTGTLYVSAASSLSDAQVIAKVGSQLATYFQTIPIGGFNGATPNQVPIEAIIGQIFRAFPEMQDVTLAAPAGDVSLLAAEVAVLSTVTLTVVRVT